jgi:hypothetical protein
MYLQHTHNIYFGVAVFKRRPFFRGFMYIDVNRILHSVKFDDAHIMLKKPMELPKYNKIIKINQINYFYKWDSFANALGIFLSCYNDICTSFKLPQSIDDIKKFQENIGLTLRNIKFGKVAFKAALKMCALAKLNMVWAKKRFSLDDWIEILVYIFIYNIFGVKKNLFNVLKLVKAVQSN